MGKVLTHMTMSLDGYVADPNDQVDELFEWYGVGDVSVPSANEDIEFQVDPASAEMLGGLTGGAVGALISGRRLFDITDGWGDNHPAGAPVVVVTHHTPADAATRWPKTTFVDGIEAAVAEARKIAGHKDVTIASTTIAQQALVLGLVDEVCVSLVPVLFGQGIPLFREPRRPPAPGGSLRRSRPSRSAPAIPRPAISGSPRVHDQIRTGSLRRAPYIGKPRPQS